MGKPVKDKVNTVPVSTFLDIGAEEFRMELIAGKKGLSNRIPEAAINRPGLALSGFYQHHAHKRVQVFGMAEYAFLTSLNREERTKSLNDFFASKIPCVVVARNKKILPEMIQLAEKYSVPVLKTKMITRVFVNGATILMENLMAPRMKIQGTMIELMGLGVMLDGKSGVGKSETALALIKKGAALVSDDITSLRVDSAGAIIGSAVNITKYHMEIKGIGIVHIPSLFGVSSVRHEKKLDLVITLCKPGSRRDEMDGGSSIKKILGVDVPQLYIEVNAGREMSNLIETAALDMKLKSLGHDAVKELDQQLIDLMTEGKIGSD